MTTSSPTASQPAAENTPVDPKDQSAAAPAADNKDAPEKPKKTAFLDRINFDTLYTSLEGEGIELNEAEKARLKEIIEKRARQFDGGSMFGSDLATDGSKFMYMVMAFVVAAYSGAKGATAEKFGEYFNNTTDTAMDKTEYKSLQDATSYIYEDMKAEGGKLAQAASLVSGQAVGFTPKDMKNSVYNQIQAPMHITDEMIRNGTSLRFDVADADHSTIAPPASTPSLPSTPGLTSGRTTG